MTDTEKTLDALYAWLSTVARQLQVETDPAEQAILGAEWDEAERQRQMLEAWLVKEAQNERTANSI